MLMKMIADLHIHSRFSMATSKEGTPENLDFWARKKGMRDLFQRETACIVSEMNT